MKDFKEFGLAVTETQAFVGDKIKIDRIINRAVIVHDYKIENSKFEGKGKCLYLQIEVGDEKKVVFTGATALIEVIQKIPADGFPFKTTIIKQNERFEFS